MNNKVFNHLEWKSLLSSTYISYIAFSIYIFSVLCNENKMKGNEIIIKRRGNIADTIFIKYSRIYLMFSSSLSDKKRVKFFGKIIHQSVHEENIYNFIKIHQFIYTTSEERTGRRLEEGENVLVNEVWNRIYLVWKLTLSYWIFTLPRPFPSLFRTTSRIQHHHRLQASTSSSTLNLGSQIDSKVDNSIVKYQITGFLYSQIEFIYIWTRTCVYGYFRLYIFILVPGRKCSSFLLQIEYSHTHSTTNENVAGYLPHCGLFQLLFIGNCRQDYVNSQMINSAWQNQRKEKFFHSVTIICEPPRSVHSKRVNDLNFLYSCLLMEQILNKSNNNKLNILSCIIFQNNLLDFLLVTNIYSAFHLSEKGIFDQPKYV